MALNISELRELTAGVVGVVDAPCPLCGPACRSPANRKRKVLRIWDDGEFVTYKCARCEASGWAKEQGAGHSESRPRIAVAPKKDADRRALAQLLWSRSSDLTDSLAAVYLRSRSCLVASPALRFLRARGEHPPAMIARFGDGPVSGVHLTKLATDGSGKAGTEKDKIMIGSSVGQPIIVTDNPEHRELVVTEGIEDAASWAIATGWTVWAAGSASRIPALVEKAASFSPVYVATDDDKPRRVRNQWMPGAGARVIAASKQRRPDIVPLIAEKLLGSGMDANGIIRLHGVSALLACIDFSEAQAMLARGLIGFHAMQAAIARSADVFASLSTPSGDR